MSVYFFSFFFAFLVGRRDTWVHILGECPLYGACEYVLGGARSFSMSAWVEKEERPQLLWSLIGGCILIVIVCI